MSDKPTEKTPLIATPGEDKNFLSPDTPGKKVKEHQNTNIWLFTSFLASLLFTVSAVIRGLMAEDLFVTKGLLSVAALGTGLSYILATKIYRLYHNDDTPLGWYQPDRDEDGNPIEGTYKLNYPILGVLMLRGALEFCGNTLLLLALKIALETGMNQGISTSMMALAGAMITLMSWLFYNEKLNWVQFFGIATILTAIVLMSLF